eukprot:SAG31_NODE_2679_length_5264_cov_7.002711_1_plen_1137_part_10
MVGCAGRNTNSCKTAGATYSTSSDQGASDSGPTLAGQIQCYNSFQQRKYIHREMLLDTGCDGTLCNSAINGFLHNCDKSTIKIKGFSGSNLVQGDCFGTVHAYVLGNSETPGSTVTFKADTVPTLNVDLMSMTEWYEERGYSLLIQPHGFSGLYKKRQDSDVGHRIPIRWDHIRKQWLIDMIIAKDNRTAIAAGKRMENEYKCHTTAQVTTIQDTGTSIAEIIVQRQDTDYLQLRNGHERIYIAGSEAGGVIEYGTQKGSTPFFSGAAYEPYHECTYEETISANPAESVEVVSCVEGESQADLLSSIEKVDGACTGGVKAGLPSRERRLTALDFHKTHGHIGHHDDCEICLKLRKSIRKVYKEVDAYKDERIGYAFSMDGITWSDKSKQGNRYTVVLRDMGPSGYIVALHLAYKNDATERIRDLKREFEMDPRFELIKQEYGHRLLSEIHTDAAGEWREDNREWQAMCKEVGITVVYGSPDDKRNSAHAENTVGIVERGAKGILMQTNAPVNYIEYAVDQFVLLHNCFPKRSDIKSSDGDAPRPLEKLSCGRISRRQCDKIIHHSIPVGTPCLVTIPHIRGSDLTNIARCRWMVAVKQYGDLPIFECPYSGHHVRSKGYVAFHLKEGQNAWTFLGIKPPKLSKARNKDSDDMQHYIKLDIAELKAMPKPTIDAAEAPAPDMQPQVITIDNDGTVFMPDHNGALVPTDKKVPALAEPAPEEPELTQEQIDLDMLVLDPHRYIGKDAYKYFPKSGIIHGTVTEANCDPDGRDFMWQITYDDGDEQLYDQEDMIQYVIQNIHGREVRDELEAAKFLGIEPELRFGGVETYQTANNDTFVEICEQIGLPKSQWRMYYEWLQQYHNYGHRCDVEADDGLKFNLPWGGDGKIKVRSKQTRFKPDTAFPIPSGSTWDKVMANHGARTSLSNPDFVNAEMCRSLHAEVYLEQRIHSMADTAISDDQNESVNSQLWMEVNSELGAEQIVSANATKISPELMKLVHNNEYKDSATGRIVPPKTVREAKSRSDWALWEYAIKVEMDALNKLGVFSHDHTLQSLREGGIHQSPVPQKIVFDAKYDPEGNFVKPKARNCIAGHKGVMRKGEHFWATFAAAPRTDTTRVLQALAVGYGYHRAAFDISVAFC